MSVIKNHSLQLFSVRNICERKSFCHVQAVKANHSPFRNNKREHVAMETYYQNNVSSPEVETEQVLPSLYRSDKHMKLDRGARGNLTGASGLSEREDT